MASILLAYNWCLTLVFFSPTLFIQLTTCPLFTTSGKGGMTVVGDYYRQCSLLLFQDHRYPQLLRKMLAHGAPGTLDARSPASASGTAAVQMVLDLPKSWHTFCLLQSAMSHSDAKKEQICSFRLCIDHKYFWFRTQISNSNNLLSLRYGNWAEDKINEKHGIVL